ncbi:membrane-bound lytic murein transglycosylase D [Franzmannia pantelleriensis]|uniref:Membrane-bound lytic murein transglycosylase D n=1 Tax=Franzmannia pantelleriensis TaxID=48727 RepID=A0A1G9FF45_9GAMM|nr:transglycosylase SLT domain-containing protein [Halomonas pantelleriensis]SDK86957.1 membrane-bound lytic murein transglycosylase D [Halomonas pantelleriensis]
MTYRTTRRLAIGLAGSLLCITITLSAAGASAEYRVDEIPHGVSPPETPGLNFWHALALKPATPQDAWTRLRDSFEWQQGHHDPRVDEWIEYYRSSPENVVEITERARPWLHWITEQVEARGLPGELALIPFVESSFDPAARSHRGASGLWQFMPGTGDALGLPRNGAYDGRLDVVASTRAALDYLEQQAEQWYEGDLELSLAAYNAGAGTVNNARRAAAARGEPDDYWHLRLPTETMNYVPKLLAIARIIDDPEQYAIELPDIEDAPAFAKVDIEQPVDLGRAAELANINREELQALNPGLLQGTISPNHSPVLLVPVDHQEDLIAGLDSIAPGNAPAGWEQYVVRRGDSLSTIASRFGASVAELRDYNGLNGDVIREGQALQVPQSTLAAN